MTSDRVITEVWRGISKDFPRNLVEIEYILYVRKNIGWAVVGEYYNRENPKADEEKAGGNIFGS